MRFSMSCNSGSKPIVCTINKLCSDQLDMCGSALAQRNLFDRYSFLCNCSINCFAISINLLVQEEVPPLGIWQFMHYSPSPLVCLSLTSCEPDRYSFFFLLLFLSFKKKNVILAEKETKKNLILGEIISLGPKKCTLLFL